MWWEHVDVVGHKLVTNGAGEMSMSKVSKQKAWLELYKRLINTESAIANCDMNFSIFLFTPQHLSLHISGVFFVFI